MKEWLLLLVALGCFQSRAANIGFWRQDEASGNLVDSTGNHPAGIPNVSPTYGQPGVPNGNYGAINIANAIGTAIEYGPSSSDEFVTIGTDNNNPVMNLDATGAFTVMGWITTWLAPAVPFDSRATALQTMILRFLMSPSAVGCTSRSPTTTGTSIIF